jgi:hypothetical protein
MLLIKISVVLPWMLLFFYCDFKCLFSGYKIFSDSTFGFSFWTFINVQNKNPPGALKNDPKKMTCVHNALNFKKCRKNL